MAEIFALEEPHPPSTRQFCTSYTWRGEIRVNPGATRNKTRLRTRPAGFPFCWQANSVTAEVCVSICVLFRCGIPSSSAGAVSMSTGLLLKLWLAIAAIATAMHRGRCVFSNTSTGTPRTRAVLLPSWVLDTAEILPAGITSVVMLRHILDIESPEGVVVCLSPWPKSTIETWN